MRNGKLHLNTALIPLQFCISILFWQIGIHRVQAIVCLVTATGNNASFVSVYRITAWITSAEQRALSCILQSICSHWQAFIEITNLIFFYPPIFDLLFAITKILFQIWFKHGQKFSKCWFGNLISLKQVEVCWTWSDLGWKCQSFGIFRRLMWNCRFLKIYNII